MAHEHPNCLAPRDRLQEYEIARVLGSGGFGITYLAKDTQLDRQVALKEYLPVGHAMRTGGSRVGPAPGSREVFDWGYRRFLDEARILQKFRHPNIPAVYRCLRANGTAYAAMEYVKGSALSDVLASRVSLSLSEWRPWLDRLLDALDHVHGNDYLHRDITPRNILIREADNQPVLIDFGAARIATGERSRTVVLTEAYAPIEQHSRRATQGPFTDIYSLAAVSYRALTGELPPSATDRAVNDEYVPLAERTTASPDWMHVVDRALAPAHTDRPQTVAGWRAKLNAAAAHEWISRQTVQAGMKSVTQRLAPLHRAAAGEPIPAVVALVLGDGDVHAVTTGGGTPLHFAAWRNPNPGILALVLDRGADIHRRTPKGGTPLHFAAWGNPNPAVVALLLDRDADIEARSEDGATPIHAAAWGNSNPEVLALLLDRGADIHARTRGGGTPLHAAAERNANPEVLALLLNRGADIHARTEGGGTPLHAAAERSANPEVLALLLNRGADIHARTEDGDTPLHVAAAQNANPAVPTLLLDRGADTHARTENGATPLDGAAQHNGDARVVALLLDHGADVCATTSGGWTPLHSAVFNENSEIAALLLARGANVNARGACGDTALHDAVEYNPKMIDLLCAHGADWSIRNYSGYTALKLQAEQGMNDSQDSVGEADEGEYEDYYRIEYGPHVAEEQMAEGYASPLYEGWSLDDPYYSDDQPYEPDVWETDQVRHDLEQISILRAMAGHPREPEDE